MNYTIVKCPACGTGNRIPAAKQHLGPRCGRCHQPLDLGGAAVPVELTDSDFQGFIASASLPVLVAFVSPSCPYCRMMAPVIANAARRFANRFIVARLDISRNGHTPSRLQIRGVPALLFFKGGRLVDQLQGTVNEEVLARRMEAALAG